MRIGFHHRTTSQTEPKVDDTFWALEDKKSMTPAEVAIYHWHEGMRRAVIKAKEGKKAGDGNDKGKLTVITNSSIVKAWDVVTATNVPQLERMSIVQELQTQEAHGAVVNFLKFSPDGKHLVTSRYTNRTMSYKDRHTDIRPAALIGSRSFSVFRLVLHYALQVGTQIHILRQEHELRRVKTIDHLEGKGIVWQIEWSALSRRSLPLH